MADTTPTGTNADTNAAHTPSGKADPSTADPADLLDGIAELLQVVATNLDTMLELIAQTDPGDGLLLAVLEDLLAACAWRCDTGIRLARPTEPDRISAQARFLGPRLCQRLGLDY